MYICPVAPPPPTYQPPPALQFRFPATAPLVRYGLYRAALDGLLMQDLAWPSIVRTPSRR